MLMFRAHPQMGVRDGGDSSMMGSGGDAARDKRKQKALRILQTDHAQVQPAAGERMQASLFYATALLRHIILILASASGG